MNLNNLHELISKYDKRFYELNGPVHDEIFKWRAAKRFRDEWFSSENNKRTFSEMFAEAKKEMYLLADNTRIFSTSGIVKVAEKNQDGVANLFKNFLFADDGGDLIIRQHNLDMFVEEFNKLCLQYFPTSYAFKQNRHSASCYLAFYSPDDNYIYKCTEAEQFAQAIEFGKDIGSGANFRLDYYYEMCDIVTEALKEHPSLLEKHFNFLTDSCYRDESLHLLTFDIIRCSVSYNFFLGMAHKTKKESIKAFTREEAIKNERRKKEDLISETQQKIDDLSLKAEEFSEISLIGVQLSHPKYGKGVVLNQENNVVKVRFDNEEKSFEIHKKYIGPNTPILEGDLDLVEAMSQYGDICKEIEELQEELDSAKNDLEKFNELC